MPPKLLVLVGLPGSGKSHFSSILCAQDPDRHVVVSQDETGSRAECERELGRLMRQSGLWTSYYYYYILLLLLLLGVWELGRCFGAVFFFSCENEIGTILERAPIIFLILFLFFISSQASQRRAW
jgi:hypothetical protein